MRLGQRVRVARKYEAGSYDGKIQHINEEYKNKGAKHWGKEVRYYVNFDDPAAYDNWLQRGSMLYVNIRTMLKKCFIVSTTYDSIQVEEYSENISVYNTNYNVKKSDIDSMLITEAAHDITTI